MTKTKAIAPILLLLAISTACIHKTGGTVTPWERVHTYNAMLAETNNGIERGAEAAVSANVLPIQQAAPLIGWTGQVAQLHLQVTALLDQGSNTTPDVSGIRAMVAQLRLAASTLPPAALGVKNPKSQQLFSQDVASIGSLADALLASLQAIGGTP